MERCASAFRPSPLGSTSPVFSSRNTSKGPGHLQPAACFMTRPISCQNTHWLATVGRATTRQRLYLGKLFMRRSFDATVRFFEPSASGNRMNASVAPTQPCATPSTCRICNLLNPNSIPASTAEARSWRVRSDFEAPSGLLLYLWYSKYIPCPAHNSLFGPKADSQARTLTQAYHSHCSDSSNLMLLLTLRRSVQPSVVPSKLRQITACVGREKSFVCTCNPARRRAMGAFTTFRHSM
jgi:hypothetical protein